MTEYLTPGVYVEEVASRTSTIEGVPTSITGFVGSAASGPIGEPVRVRSFADHVRTFGEPDPGSELGYAVLQFFANGGSDAWVVSVPPVGSIADALTALDAVQGLAILCLPGATDPEVLRAALRYADRRRAFMIVDPPGPDPEAAAALVRELSASGSANAAVYFPPLLIADPLDPERSRTSSPSGSVAGVYGRTDASRGLWRAPAGNDAVLLGVRDVAVQLEPSAQATLDRSGVNTIRAFPGTGPVVWGARTVLGADGDGSDLRYVPVRRLVSFVERSIEGGTRWAAFEPNDEPLWAALRLAVATFLDGLFRLGAFAGSRPQDAYFVRCDRSSMTQDDIDRGNVRIVVGVAAVRPAEFVIVEISRLANGSATEQLGPAVGEPGATVRLGRRPVAGESFTLQIEGPHGWTVWSSVHDLAAAGPDDAAYVLDPEAGTVRFGDGAHGTVPPSGSRIQATYRYGSRRDGNTRAVSDPSD